MTVDPEIQVGDVVHDLVERGHMRVLQKEGSVAEYREREDFDLAQYKTHPLLGVTDEEDAWRCVYLSSDPSVGYSQSYVFPESRLARAPVEEARDDIDRPYVSIQRAQLAAIFQTSMEHRADFTEFRKSLLFFGEVAGVDTQLLAEAHELARAATGTGNPEEVPDARDAVSEYYEQAGVDEGGESA